LAIPVGCAHWVASGDPDVRVDQYPECLAAIGLRTDGTVPNIVLLLADHLRYGDI